MHDGDFNYPKLQFIAVEMTKVRYQVITKTCLRSSTVPKEALQTLKGYIFGAPGSQILDICGTVLAALQLRGLFLSRQEREDGV